MTVSSEYAAQGDTLAALDAAAQASAAFKRADRRGSALGALSRMRELGERSGEVRTPAIASASAPVVFTGREREVIMLAGAGLTNREIAQRLDLSVRTVEGHLYRAAGRIGAKDRNELARTITDGLAEPA
jgi:DNA-binding CsgD family transcriptional regulator